MPKISDGRVELLARTLTPAQHRALKWLVQESPFGDRWLRTCRACTGATAAVLEQAGCIRYETRVTNRSGLLRRVKLLALGRLVVAHGPPRERLPRGDGGHGGSRR